MNDHQKQIPIPRRAIRMAAAVIGILFFLVCLWMSAVTGLSRVYQSYAANARRLDGADAALRLTPTDPQAHLIRAALLRTENRLTEAIKEYEQAAALRPRDYVLRLSLGFARDEAEDHEGAITAFKDAVALAPDYAEPHWQLGNVLLRAGRTDEAFMELRRASQSNRAFLLPLIDLAWNIYQADIALVEQAVQPQDSAARLELARFAARHGKAADAAKIFRNLGNAAQEDRRLLLTDLLAAKQFKLAYEVWSSGPEPGPGTAAITDGGFEEQIKPDDPGFGWQIARNVQSMRAAVDQTQPHQGRNSLRLDWAGDSDPASQILSQLVLVEPNARYRLRFAGRSEELVTGGLPMVAVIDANSKETARLVQSEPLGPKTTPWRESSVEFATGNETNAVYVVVRRQNCSRSPCPIFGRVWLDDFAIEKL